MPKNKRGEIILTAAQIVLIIGVVITALFAIIGFAPNYKKARRIKSENEKVEPFDYEVILEDKPFVDGGNAFFFIF